MALTRIGNQAITLDAAEIPNLDASKIVSGTIDNNRLNITEFDDNKIVNDISTLAIRQASNENKTAYNTQSMYVDVFQDASGITNLSGAVRRDEEYVYSATESSGSQTIYMGDETTGGENNIRLKQIQDGRTIGTGGWSGSESNDYVHRGGNYDGFALGRVY